MSSFDLRIKYWGHSIKDGLIITATIPWIFFALNAVNVKPSKASLDAMGIIKIAGGICGGVSFSKILSISQEMYQRVKDCFAAEQCKNFIAPAGYDVTVYQPNVQWLTYNLGHWLPKRRMLLQD